MEFSFIPLKATNELSIEKPGQEPFIQWVGAIPYLQKAMEALLRGDIQQNEKPQKRWRGEERNEEQPNMQAIRKWNKPVALYAAWPLQAYMQGQNPIR